MACLTIILLHIPWTSVILLSSDVAVIVYAIFAILLWRETNKSADAAIKNAASAEANAESARKTLDAMVEANRINREALQRVERAYVTFPIVSVDLERITDASDKITGWTFYIPVENTGNTAVKELKVHVNWHWRPDELPRNFDYPDYGPDEEIRFPLAAKERIFSSPMEIGREIIEKLAVGQINVYFYAWATYSDVFEHTQAHRTAFCHKVNLQQVDKKVRLQLTFHGNHNYQD